MGDWRGKASFAIMGMLLMSALTSINVLVYLADTELVQDSLELFFDPTCMSDECTYFAESTGTNIFNLGEGDGLDDDQCTSDSCLLVVRVNVIDFDSVWDLWLNITGYDTSVFDFADTNPGLGGVQVSAGPYPGPYSMGFTLTMNYEFDILATTFPSLADRTVTATWDYIDDNGGTPVNRMGNIDLVIDVRSIFEDPLSAPASDYLDVLPDMLDATGGSDDPYFEAGDFFAASELPLQNYDDDHITDLTCTITPPAGGEITFAGPNYCLIPAGIPGAWAETLTYRTDVQPNAAPGLYTGTAQIVYTRQDSGLAVTESGHQIDWGVDFSFRDEDPTPVGFPDSDYQCIEVPGTNLYNGTGTKMMNITIMNNGNTPIYNAQFRLEQGDMPPFLHLQTPPSVVNILQLNIGEALTISCWVDADANVSMGSYSSYMSYDGSYFNDGSLGEATGFQSINGGDDLANGGDDLYILLTINIVADTPVAVDDDFTLNENSGLNFLDVLSNDFDNDGSGLSVSAVTQGQFGTVTIAGGGIGINYAPDTNFIGGDTFYYTVTDGNGSYDQGAVAVTVQDVNNAPAILNGNNDSAFAGQFYSENYYATDPDYGDTLSWSVETNAGWLSMTAVGLLSGTPAENVTASYWVNVSVTDGSLADFTNFTLSVSMPDIPEAEVIWNNVTEYSNNTEYQNETVYQNGTVYQNNTVNVTVGVSDADSDSDGWTDAEEILAGTDPLDSADEPTDADGDGIADFMDIPPAGQPGTETPAWAWGAVIAAVVLGLLAALGFLRGGKNKGYGVPQGPAEPEEIPR